MKIWTIIPGKLWVHAIERSVGQREFVAWILFWTLTFFVSGLRGMYVYVPRGGSRLTVVWLVLRQVDTRNLAVENVL